VSEPLYGVMAEFRHGEALLAAARRAREAGYASVEAYAPFAVPGLAEAAGMRRNGVPACVLAGGLIGAIGGLMMQWYSATLSYPINVGGRPAASWAAFVPAAFELMLLGGALFGFVGMLALNGLPRLRHPVFNVPEFDLASRDRFFLCLPVGGTRFAPESTRRFLAEQEPLAVWDVPQ
jgi:hypothetical protein